MNVSDQGAGPWLREKRLDRGWTRPEMARRMYAAMIAAAEAKRGKVPSARSIERSLGAWEGDGRYPGERWRAMICQVFGVGLEDFPAGPRPAAFLADPSDLDPDDPRPWVQVARMLLEEIEAGKLKRGDPVPRAAELASETGVSAPTVRKVYRYLQGHEILRFWPGAGYYVSGQQEDGPRPGDLAADRGG